MLDLLGLKKSVGALAEQLKGLRVKIEQLKRQREDIATAPPALEDVRAAYTRAVDERRDSFRSGLVRAIESFKREPASLSQPGIVRSGSLLFLAHENYTTAPAAIVENGIAALFSEQVVKALSSELAALDWSGAGLPLAKREKKLAELDAEIATLERQCSELTAEARDVGVIIDLGT